MYIIICEIDRQSRFNAWGRVLRAGMQSAQSAQVQWDDPEGWDGEGGGWGVQDGEHVYIQGWFMWLYGKNHHNIVK